MTRNALPLGLEEYAQHDATALARLVRRGDVSADELCRLANAAIDRLNPQLNCIAERFDRPEAAADGAPGTPFSGVPFLVKDLVLQVRGKATRMGSRLGSEEPAAEDTELMARFRRAGLVTLGKTTTPEFGADVTTESLLNGATRNPWNLDHSPGGSSGGAAAAVAAGIVPMAHANDGLGSIRIPAAACGLFGLKPTRQRTPTGPHAWDLLGGRGVEFAVTRTVRDAAALLDAVHGPDAGAPSHAPRFVDSYLAAIRQAVRPLTIAFTTRTFSGAPVHHDCEQAVLSVARCCERLGHAVEEAAPSFDWTAYLESLIRTVAANAAAAVADLTREHGAAFVGERLEPHNLLMAQRGQGLSAVDLVRAQNGLSRTPRQIGPFFTRFEVLLTPMLARPPARLGELAATYVDDHRYIDCFAGDGYSPFAGVFNVTGQPAASLPASVDSAGVPIGVQLVARFGREEDLLMLAAQIEATVRWDQRRPIGGLRAPFR
jgi:amidase